MSNKNSEPLHNHYMLITINNTINKNNKKNYIIIQLHDKFPLAHKTQKNIVKNRVYAACCGR